MKNENDMRRKALLLLIVLLLVVAVIVLVVCDLCLFAYSEEREQQSGQFAFRFIQERHNHKRQNYTSTNNVYIELHDEK